MPTLKNKPAAATTERVQDRGLRSKTWNTATPGRRIMQAYIGPIHWDNAGTLEDIDFTPTLSGNSWDADTGPLSVNINNVNGPGFGITGKKVQGTAQVDVLNSSGSPTLDTTDPLRIRYTWVETLPGIDVEIQVRGGGVYTYFFVKDPTSDHVWEERITTTGDFDTTYHPPTLVDVFGDKLQDNLSVADLAGNVKEYTISKTFPLVLTPDQYPLVMY